ncbi:hypothetical protein ACVBEJ_10095 [Porticoccus sp. GXU_MW_L64]
MKVFKILLCTFIFLSVNSHAEDTIKIQFGSGTMLVELPFFMKKPNLSQNGFMALIDDEGLYKLEMSKIEVGDDMPDGFGMYAVKKMAEGRGLEVKNLGDRILLQEPFVQHGQGKEGVRNTNFSIGLNKSIVTMTLTTPPNEIIPEDMASKINAAVNSAITTVAEL